MRTRHARTVSLEPYRYDTPLTLIQAVKSDIASTIVLNNATSLPISFVVCAEMQDIWLEIVPTGNAVAILGIIFLAVMADHNDALEVVMPSTEKWRYAHLYPTALQSQLF